MNTEFDEIVRDSMTWFTDGVEVPAGIQAEARRHLRSQRRARMSWIGAGSAVAAAAVVIVGTVGAGSAPHPSLAKGGAVKTKAANGHEARVTIQTTAVVVRRVERALAKAAAGNPVAFTRETSTGARLVVFIPHSGPTEFSPDLIAETWSRGNLARTDYVTPAGRVLFRMQSAVSSGKSVDTSVSFPHRAWWRGTYAAPAATKPQVACTLGETGLTKAQWTREIKKLLSCGAAAFAGYQRVDGVQAVRLKLSSTINKTCAASNYQSKCTPVPVGWSGAVWANASTYLPVRLVAHGEHYGFRIDFRWLAPIPANLAKLRPPIPAGFRHV